MTDAELAAIRERSAILDKRPDSWIQRSIDVSTLLTEIDRLTAITSSIRRCFACGRETLAGRAIIEPDEEEPTE